MYIMLGILFLRFVFVKCCYLCTYPTCGKHVVLVVARLPSKLANAVEAYERREQQLLCPYLINITLVFVSPRCFFFL